jgi:putative FmdB family regulatory protein
MTSTTRGQSALPTYQYRCTECDHEFEEFQSFTDDALTVCPVCGGRLRKVFNAVGVVFKGSGFYRTDSRTAGAASTAGSTSTSSTGGSGDTSPSDSGSKSTTSDSSTSGSGASSGSSSTSSSTAGSSSSG